MKLQNLTVIFIIIIIPIILLVSLYISTGLKTIKYQSMYDEGLLNATHDAIYAFEINIAQNEYSDNAETKRNILKSSIKMFERSLANTCNISSYNTDEIEEYIPAIVFGMHDGFYMYAPSYLETTGKYEHNLKNYVYYSEELDDKGTVIIYSLDNYVIVAGDFGNGYEKREGYLIDLTDNEDDGTKYKGITINKETINGKENTEGIKYYKEGYEFTKWFNDKIGSKIKDENNQKYLYIDSNNDPENENSLFVQHKRKIIKNKIEDVLNSSITAYSKRIWGQNYKMPKLLEEEWQKIYSNISMITFFQGRNIGLTKYNGYCVLNSTNSNEYVNPNLMYFIDENNSYHDIRCQSKGNNLNGYKIGDFRKKKTIDEETSTAKYEYTHNELACYECVNGTLNATKNISQYLDGLNDDSEIKIAYFTSLGRERYNTTKLLKTDNSNENILYLYNYGNEYENRTGGWLPSIMDIWEAGYNHTGALYEKESTLLRIGDRDNNAFGDGVFTTSKAIEEIADYEYLCIKGKVASWSQNSSYPTQLNLYLSKTPLFITYTDYSNPNNDSFNYREAKSEITLNKNRSELRNIVTSGTSNSYSGKYNNVYADVIWRSTERKGSDEEFEFKIRLKEEVKDSIRNNAGCHITVCGYAHEKLTDMVNIEIYQVYLEKE